MTEISFPHCGNENYCNTYQAQISRQHCSCRGKIITQAALSCANLTLEEKQVDGGKYLKPIIFREWWAGKWQGWTHRGWTPPHPP